MSGAIRVVLVRPAQPTNDRLFAQCRAWAAEHGIQLDVEHATGPRGLADSLAGIADGAEAVVVSPGARAADDQHAAKVAASLGCYMVTVEPEPSPPTEPSALDRVAGARIHGRGTESYRWALAHLAARARWPVRRHAYGPDPEQETDLRLPGRDPAGGAHPVAVLVHGGFWRAQWGKDLMEGLAIDLAISGWATWNVEYRRVGRGGGWPTTADDVTQAMAALQEVANRARLDLSRMVLIGHSAGAHLALLTAQLVRPRLVVSLAGVTDLVAAADAGLGEDAVRQFLGGMPAEVPDRYAAASPIGLLPLGTPVLLVHGDADERVPVEQSRAFHAAAAAAGDQAELVELAEVDHFAVIDPASMAWQAVRSRLVVPHWSERRHS